MWSDPRVTHTTLTGCRLVRLVHYAPAGGTPLANGPDVSGSSHHRPSFCLFVFFTFGVRSLLSKQLFTHSFINAPISWFPERNYLQIHLLLVRPSARLLKIHQPMCMGWTPCHAMPCHFLQAQHQRDLKERVGCFGSSGLEQDVTGKTWRGASPVYSSVAITYLVLWHSKTTLVPRRPPNF